MIEVCVAGAINYDINLFIKRFAKIGEEVSVKNITRIPGGKAANVAVASSRILGFGRTALIGCLGRDVLGEKQIEILKKEGIDVSGIQIVDNEESGQAYIIIDNEGRNVINTFFGANLKLLPKNLHKKETLTLISESSIVAIIDPPFNTILDFVLLSKRYGKIIAWDPGVRSTLEIKKLQKILKNIDYLFVNQVEAKNLSGQRDLEKVWERLSKINGSLNLILKRGEKGCVLINSEQKIKIRAIDLEEIGLKVINTVGCGDAFLGTFLAYKVEGLKDNEALERANLAAALKATKPETRGSPKKIELNKYLNYRKFGQITKI